MITNKLLTVILLKFQEEYESNVRTALYLVSVASRLLEDPGNPEVINLTISVVYNLIFGVINIKIVINYSNRFYYLTKNNPLYFCYVLRKSFN